MALAQNDSPHGGRWSPSWRVLGVEFARAFRPKVLFRRTWFRFWYTVRLEFGVDVQGCVEMGKDIVFTSSLSGFSRSIYMVSNNRGIS